MDSLVQFFISLIDSFNYLNIFLLMVLESSFIPFPSEIIILPAAYLAQQGSLNIFLVFLAGVLGSVVGAIINYILAWKLGRTILYRLVDTKLAKFLFLNKKKLERSEKYFLEYGSGSTFFGRLIPVIRQLISIPAGLAKMNFFKFVFFTALGSSFWVLVLSVLGYVAGEKQLVFLRYYKEIIFGLLFIFLIILVIKKFLKRKKLKKEKYKDKKIEEKL
jgi:membrane protein DedA with SNARE-associated domain